jgi:hypothetical protein
VAAKKHHDAKQAQQEEASAPEEPPPGQAPAPAAADGTTPDVMEQLKKLGELHESGVLTDEEFAAEKAKLLG